MTSAAVASGIVMLMLSWKSHSSTMRVTVTSPTCHDFMCSLAMASPLCRFGAALLWLVARDALGRQLGGRQRRLAENEVRPALADHHAGRIGVAADDARHDRGVGNTQASDPVEAEL